MIIKIDSSLLHAAKNGHFDDVFLLFKDLMIARVSGNVALDFEKKVILSFIDLFKGEKDLVSFMKHEKNQITFNKEYLSEFDFRLNLVFSIYPMTESKDTWIRFEVENYATLKYELDFFSPFDKPKFITENSSSDGLIFKKICEHYFSKRENKSYHFRFENINGGGDTSAEVLKNVDAHPILVFAMVDCDKKYPKDKYGSTSKKVIKHFCSLELSHNLLVIEVHELENLIPLEWFRLKSNKAQLQDITFLIEINKIQNECMNFYDFKNSFGFRKIYIDQDTEISKYWKPIFDLVLDEIYIENKRQEFEASPNDVKILGGFSSLFKIVTKSFLDDELKTFSQPELEVQWENIGKWMLERFLVSRPIRL